MIDMFANIAYGLSVASTFQNLMLAFTGCLVGTLIGVLPGVGPIATIAMLLPMTYGFDPAGALIMLAGIYYGAQYGGSTTAILVNMPGEASAVVTALDGHAMARKGRAGVALGIAAIGSFIAGTFATLLIAALAVPLAKVAMVFRPWDYFSLMLMGLVLAVVLARGSIPKAVAMILLGVLLSTVGTDLETGRTRLTFGLPYLVDGIDFAILSMGLFGVSEIMRNVEGPQTRVFGSGQIGRLLPGRAEFRASLPAILRGTGIGSLLGILPGSGAILGPFASYAVEKKLSKHPETFGHGAIEGVAGPESANNAGAQTSFIPLLTLGIPPNAVMALMVGAMMIHGILPGPQVMTRNPDLFWGMIASMWIGNLMLLVINLPMIGIWVRLLKVPYEILFPAILMFCCIGAFSIGSASSDVISIAVYGVAGYLLIKLGFEPAPLILGFVLGDLLEENLRRALVLSDGSISPFLLSPISVSFLIVAAISLVLTLLPSIRKGREEVFVED